LVDIADFGTIKKLLHFALFCSILGHLFIVVVEFLLYLFSH
jgi:hypothetical protein